MCQLIFDECVSDSFERIWSNEFVCVAQEVTFLSGSFGKETLLLQKHDVCQDIVSHQGKSTNWKTFAYVNDDVSAI